MIPYFELPSTHLGPITIGPFGILVSIGILVATYIIEKEARRRGLDPAPVSRMETWALAGGAVGAHLVHLFLYHPEELQRGPLQILRVWDGLSSTGGVIGGLLAILIYLRRSGLRFAPYADALALGVAPGWAIARVGCFVVHDHPGRLTHFPLAVGFTGGARHDLGLYDALLLAALSLLLGLLARRGLLTGRLLGLLAILYGLGRFGFDTLRATDLPYIDARYAGLTPAQYGCAVLAAYGVWQLAAAARGRRSPRVDSGTVTVVAPSPVAR